jgi:hypothetical protein
MCDGIDRRIANRKLPRPVERDGGLTKADPSDAVHGAVGRRRRSLGPATVPEQKKHRKRNAKSVLPQRGPLLLQESNWTLLYAFNSRTRNCPFDSPMLVVH